MTIKTAQELVDAINTLDDKTFAEHVNDQKHDFADWLNNLDKIIADKAREAKTKEDLIAALEDSIYR